MALVNVHYLNLQDNYLFADIAKKVNAFKVMHPKADVISLGIGDVTQPLCDIGNAEGCDGDVRCIDLPRLWSGAGI